MDLIYGSARAWSGKADGLFCASALLQSVGGTVDLSVINLEAMSENGGMNLRQLSNVCWRMGLYVTIEQYKSGLPVRPAILHLKTGRYLAQLQIGQQRLVFDPSEGASWQDDDFLLKDFSGYSLILDFAMPVREQFVLLQRVWLKRSQIESDLLLDPAVVTGSVVASASSIAFLNKKHIVGLVSKNFAHLYNDKSRLVTRQHFVNLALDSGLSGDLRTKSAAMDGALCLDAQHIESHFDRWCAEFSLYLAQGATDVLNLGLLLTNLRSILPFDEISNIVEQAVVQVSNIVSGSDLDLGGVEGDHLDAARYLSARGKLHLMEKALRPKPYVDLQTVDSSPRRFEILGDGSVRAVRIQHFLPDQLVESIKKCIIEGRNQSVPARVAIRKDDNAEGHTARIVDDDFRQSYSIHPDDQTVREVKKILREALPEVVRALGISVSQIDAITTDITGTPNRGFLRLHVDKSVDGTIYPERRLSYVIYIHLKPHRFKGGHISFHPSGHSNTECPLVLPAIDNSALFFSPTTMHQVHRVFTDRSFESDRFTVNGWILGLSG